MKNSFQVRLVSMRQCKYHYSVATALVGSAHDAHAMVLDCVLADIKKDISGQPMTDSNGNYLLENYVFKFKNTYKNNKAIEIRAGFFLYLETYLNLISDAMTSPLEFYYIKIDFIPEVGCEKTDNSGNKCKFITNKGGRYLGGHTCIF